MEEGILPISTVTPPTIRRSGRQSRLSLEDLGDLVEAFRSGTWASDQEIVPTKSAAYQRAQAAVDLIDQHKLLGEDFNVIQIKKGSYPVDASDLSKGWLWAIGPYPEGETPRQPRRRNTST